VDLSSSIRGDGEFDHFGSSVIGDDDDAPTAHDLDDEAHRSQLSMDVPTTPHETPDPERSITHSEDKPSTGRPSNEEEAVTHEERAEASETLRIQAEQAQSLNIVLELTLDGEGGQQFAWINPAWYDVIG
jgi:serine/threonine-protein kinase RIM15